jgi:hypothetical protein
VTENLKVITEERDRMKIEINSLSADVVSYKKQVDDLKSISDNANKTSNTVKAQVIYK